MVTDRATSFFGDQEGPFSISVRAISAVAKPTKHRDQDESNLTPFPYPYRAHKSEAETEQILIEISATQASEGDGILSRIWKAGTDCVRMR